MSFLTHTVYILAIISYSDCLSITKVSDVTQDNAVKEKPRPEFYPDWVPFKNKHGDELGQFVDVKTKSKVKKRLALPMNFVLKAVAEPDDDYYEKGQADGDDYYEKKEWTDANRPANNLTAVESSTAATQNHTDLSDIDGVVNIIRDYKPSAVAEAIQKSAEQLNKKPEDLEDYEYADEDKEESVKPKKSENKEEYKDVSKEAQEETDKEPATAPTAGEKQEEKAKSEEQTSKSKENVQTEDQKEDDKKAVSGQEETDDEEPATTTEKIKKEPTEEEKQNEIKKQKVLAAVDELKERHAQEAKFIQEKLRGDDDSDSDEDFNVKHAHNKYENGNYRSRKNNDYSDSDSSSDSDEDYDDSRSKEDKYKLKPREEDITTTTTTQRPKNSAQYRRGRKKAFGLKTPRYFPRNNRNRDQDKVETTTENVAPLTTKSSDFDEEVRISLVPSEDDDDLERPTLFFPQKRKMKRRRKLKTYHPNSLDITAKPVRALDSPTAVDEYVKSLTSPADTEASAADISTSVTESGPSELGKNGPTSADVEKPADVAASGSDTAPSALDVQTAPSGVSAPGVTAVADALAASSDHKKEKEPEHIEHDKGGAKEYHSEHKEESGEHGKKAYEGKHKDYKTAAGHHDKEDHKGNYDDHGGYDKQHHDEKGHYGSHHHAEHGKKHAKYEESGKHSKGHSTKGSHDIHKKEEYEKKVEFFEEDGDSGEEEKHGGYHSEKEHKKGGHYKKGNLHAAHEHHGKGETGKFAKGGHAHSHKGHKKSEGHDGHGRHGQSHFHKEGKEAGKKWVYHHGSPAKTANLVVIDRRGDKYMQGPTFYGNRPFYG